ncbi:MAG: RNA pseudouridine synthase [Sinobacterium sp.]|nr:RNA pseudouridine synthase [Sinobacterium sp.]
MVDETALNNPSIAIESLQPDIVFQHSDWVLLHKPVGYSVQDLAAVYQQHFDAFHPVHRLDKETSGLWLIALTGEANQLLSQAFQKKSVKKAYLAIVDAQGIKKKQGRIIGDMGKSRRKSWRLLKSKQNPAKTQFTSVSLQQGLRLVWLAPSTGKTHQLRVAMKSNSSAIIGDDIYALETAPQFDRLYLHAYALAFTYGDNMFEFTEAPKTGQYFLQESFTEVLEALILKVK